MELKRSNKQKENCSKIQYKSIKGVTIIAVVITIIVMLILAGATISLTMRGDGIFSSAIEAKERQEITKYEEKIELARGKVALNNLGEVTLDNLIAQIYEEKIVPEMAITKLDEEKAKLQTKEGYMFIITADKIEYAGKGNVIPTPPTLEEANVVFKQEPAANIWTNGSVKVSIEGKIEEVFTIQYSFDGVNWYDYTKEIEITENKAIYACLRNAIGEQSTNYSSNVITNIDKIDPVEFIPSITSTTNSITVDASGAKDAEGNEKYGQSGIKEIWYSKDAGTTWETNEENKAETNYTFEELAQGATYNIQVKVIDNAGNQITTKAQGIETTTITQLTIAVTDSDTWTNETKTVTITAGNNNYSIIRYTLDGSIPTTSSTEYTGAFTVSSNCTITAAAFDSTNQIGIAATDTVEKIDKLKPATETATGKVEVTGTTTNSVAVKVTAEDQAETSTNGCSGIKGYYYSSNGGSSYTETITTNTTHTFTNLAQSQTYDIRVKVVDNAGNETVLRLIDTSAGTTLTVAELTIGIGDANKWTNGTKQVTITAANSNYSTIRYTTNGTTPTTSSTAYTAPFTVSSNCTITAIAFDSTNQGGVSATNTVQKIDKTVPEKATIAISSTSGTTATVTATVTHSDKNSGVDIKNCKYKLNTSTSALGTNPNSYTDGSFSSNGQQIKINVTTSNTYYLHVLTKDSAGNYRETISSAVAAHVHVASCYSTACRGSFGLYSSTTETYATCSHTHTAGTNLYSGSGASALYKIAGGCFATQSSTFTCSHSCDINSAPVGLGSTAMQGNFCNFCGSQDNVYMAARANDGIFTCNQCGLTTKMISWKQKPCCTSCFTNKKETVVNAIIGELGWDTRPLYGLSCTKTAGTKTYTRTVSTYRCNTCAKTTTYYAAANSGTCPTCGSSHSVAASGTTSTTHNAVTKYLICGK